jgi:hypothetical protein
MVSIFPEKDRDIRHVLLLRLFYLMKLGGNDVFVKIPEYPESHAVTTLY